MRKIFTICLICGGVFAQDALYVEAFDEQGNNPSQLTLRVRVTNNTTDTLRNIHIRYFLPFDSSKTIEIAPYYMPDATFSLDTLGQTLSTRVKNNPKWLS